MKKLDKIRNREAARVLLIATLGTLKTACDKLLETSPGNIRIAKDWNTADTHIDRLLRLVVSEQENE